MRVLGSTPNWQRTSFTPGEMLLVLYVPQVGISLYAASLAIPRVGDVFPTLSSSPSLMTGQPEYDFGLTQPGHELRVDRVVYLPALHRGYRNLTFPNLPITALVEMSNDQLNSL